MVCEAAFGFRLKIRKEAFAWLVIFKVLFWFISNILKLLLCGYNIADIMALMIMTQSNHFNLTLQSIIYVGFFSAV